MALVSKMLKMERGSTKYTDQIVAYSTCLSTIIINSCYGVAGGQR